MKKQYYFLLVLTFLLLNLGYSQQTIPTKLSKQQKDALSFSFDLSDDSYQQLSLIIELESIPFFNRSSFIAVCTEKEEQLMEIGRFFLAETSSDEEHPETLEPFSFAYEFDVCMWQNILKESSKIILKTDGNMDDLELKVKLMGSKGEPSIKVKEIIPLWMSNTNGFAYGKEGISLENLPTRTLKLPSKQGKAFIQVLVHGVAKNKNPTSRFYFLHINGKEIAKRSIWRDDCAYNPIFPQSINWYESRPNWCPGLKIYPLKHLISEETLNKGELDIDLRFQKDIMENSGIYSYVISATMFIIEEPEKDVNVAITEILSPNKDKWHQRYNPVCGSPVLVIKNLGNETLNQITFNYGYNFQTDNKYRWKGELAFLEEEIVYLPSLNWYFFEKDDEPEKFTAIISSANKKEEAFPRGKMTTNMQLADVYPYRLTFHIRTDKEAIHNALEIFDDNGNPYFLSEELVADTNYYFHVNFNPGCYEMVLFDAKGNGINQRDDKLPVLEIIDQKKGNQLKSFNGNFGGEIREQFMIFR